MRLDEYLSLTSLKAIARQVFYYLVETEEWVHKQRRFDEFHAVPLMFISMTYS